MRKVLMRTPAWSLLLALVVAFAFTAFALTGGVALAGDQTVTVTGAPAFISIVSGVTEWTINGLATGNGYIEPSKTYYSNPQNDTAALTNPVADNECAFNITNTSSVNVTVVVNWGNFTGGDAMTNGDTGSAGASTFGAYAAKNNTDPGTAQQVCKITGSTTLYTTTSVGEEFSLTVWIATQTGDWSSGASSTSTITIVCVMA